MLTTCPTTSIKTESPDSPASSYSTVYSPAASNSTTSNVEADCCRSSTKVRRQRLRPWLINQINSGEVPGLVWMDKENMIFKIPWKHFGRPGVDMYQDALLFRRWALHTKKFEQGRPSDISTWKTRFRCALHKLPDIIELNDMNHTEGEEPYRVYQFKTDVHEPYSQYQFNKYKKIDDELESSVGSVGSPVSSSVESPNFAAGIDSHRTSISTAYSRISPTVMGSSADSPQKVYVHKPNAGGIAPADIQKWRYYEQMRFQDPYPDEKSTTGVSDECGYECDDEESRKTPLSKPTRKEDHPMDDETDEDDMSWNSRGCIQINQTIQPEPPVVPRPCYLDNTPQRAFEPPEKQYSMDSTSVGVIRTAAQKRANVPEKETTYDDDDDDLFFRSCAKRIKKLDTRRNGYLKLKISELFYLVENSQQQRNNQSYRYQSDPPPLISNANVREGGRIEYS